MFKVLFLCTENSCRSQMAEGLVNHDLEGLVQAFSAGVQPRRVNPRAMGTEEEILTVFRRVRDDLREQLIPLLRQRSAGKNVQ